MATAYALADPAHPYHTAPRGVWLLARRPVDTRYPCRCRPGCGQKCDCRGRVDLGPSLPTSCCAVRAADTANRATTQPDTGETP